MVDVTDIPQARVGDPVVLLGGEGPQTILPEELASWAQTISYEILAGISKRVPRSYPKQEQEAGQTVKGKG
jgi:alanine racemase